MRVSHNWLAQFLPGVAAVDDLAAMLTDIGIEVDGVSTGPALTGVIVGKIHSSRRLPKTKLSLCQVDAGGDADITVVCGAANAKRGLRVPLVLPGTTLPDGRVIATTTIHGQTSNGMLCSAAELGLGDAAGELLDLGRRVTPGTALADLIEADDVVYDLSITPDRGDWLSMLGVAREIAAKLGQKIKPPKVPKLTSKLPAVNVTIDADVHELCPKFTAIPLAGINAAVPTPIQIRERLRRCGVRPISIVVDITNYVMLELGQPLHAFDHAKLTGDLHVRFATKDEPLELLDGTPAKLGTHMLVVADAAGAQAAGGVMGGLASGVTASTTKVVLEAAHWVPKIIRGRTRELNISSEAAFRFERGVDPSICELAVTTAAKLIQRYCGGEVGPLTVTGATPAVPAPLALADGKVAQLTGVAVTGTETRQRLRRLGFTVARIKQALEVTAPPWRFDIDCAEDLVEEVVRIAGFDSIPTTLPQLTGKFVPVAANLLDGERARTRLVADGFNEIVTYAFVDPKWEQDFYANTNPPQLQNPLAVEHSVMRTGLLGGLVDRALYNAHHRQVRLRLFEIGRCFGSAAQPQHLGMLVWGENVGTHGMPAANQDFYDLAGCVQRLFPATAVEFTARKDHPALHPGRAASIVIAGQQVGVIGELHPRLLGKDQYELTPPPVVAELEFDLLTQMPVTRNVQPISKLPLIRRDLAVVVAATVTVADLIKSALAKQDAEHIVEVSVFDYYAGGKLAPDQRSVGLRIVMQGRHENLVDEQINATLAAVTNRLATEHGASLRT